MSAETLAELRALANADLMAEVKRVQAARGMSFERAWDVVSRESPGLFRVAASLSSETVEARAHRLIRESGGRMLMGQALHLARAQLTTTTTARAVPVKAIEQATPPRMTSTSSVESLEHVEADESGFPEHPFQQEANRRGLTLIQGGFFTPLA